MRRALVVAGLAVLAGGCGGGGVRQDADEPSGTFKLEIVGASFPARQHIAEPVVMRLRVRNADRRSLPNVAVTVLTRPPAGSAAAAFGQRQAPGSGLSDSLRPVWVLDRGPVGGETADQNVWDAGPLSAGQAKTLTWRLVAARAGTYTIAYRVFPGLTGRAKAARGHTSGVFRVRIIDRPVAAHVGPGGQVIRGPLPGSSGR